MTCLNSIECRLPAEMSKVQRCITIRILSRSECKF